MRVVGALLILLLFVLVGAYAAGIRLVLLPPDAARPEGATLITAGVPDLRPLDSPKAYCLLNDAQNVERCVQETTASALAPQGLLLEMRYLPQLERLVGGQAGTSAMLSPQKPSLQNTSAIKISSIWPG